VHGLRHFKDPDDPYQPDHFEEGEVGAAVGAHLQAGAHAGQQGDAEGQLEVEPGGHNRSKQVRIRRGRCG